MTLRDDLTGPDGRKYAVRFSREDLEEIARHIHWIPMLRGHAREFMDRTHPGWRIDVIVPLMRRLDLLVMRRGGTIPRVGPGIRALWLTSRYDALVER